jgi:hypothetical protein
MLYPIVVDLATLENWYKSSFLGEIKLIGGLMSSCHRAIGAELEQTVVIEGLVMEIVSIVIHHPLNTSYPVVKDEFQFIPLKFTRKFVNDTEKIFWPGELLSCQCCLHVPEKP